MLQKKQIADVYGAKHHSLQQLLQKQKQMEAALPVRVFGQVQGEIPPWVEGTLLRYDSGAGSISKSEDVDLKSINANCQENSIHRFIVSNGKVSLEQCTLPKKSMKKRRASSSVSSIGSLRKELFGMPNCQNHDQYYSRFERLMSRFEQIVVSSMSSLCDSCNANLCFFGDQLYAITESSTEVQRIDPESMKVMENINISDVIPVNTFTAHPHVLEDGSVLNIGNCAINDQAKPQYYVVHTPPGRNSEENVLKDSIILASIPSRWKFNQSYYHSFGLTGDKLVFIEQPLRLSVTQTLWSRLCGKPITTSALKWYSNEKTQMFVTSLSNGQVSPVNYWTDKLFVFHHINTYEENGSLIMDVIGYDSGQCVADLAMQRLNGSPNKKSSKKSKSSKSYNPTARRYILPLIVPAVCPLGTNLLEDFCATTAQAIYHGPNSIQLIPEYLYNQTFELPKINNTKQGLKYTYVYGVSNNRKSDSDNEALPNMIVKLNVTTSESVSWSEDGKICVCEPVYVANLDGKDEDDGVLLITLQNLDNPEKVTLLMLDAEIMAELARVEFQTKDPISHSSHGPWIPSTSTSTK